MVILPRAIADAPRRIDGLESMLPVVALDSGSYAAMPDAAPIGIVDGTIQIGYTQDGTGDASPTNIRTINGWKTIPVHHRGKNLIPYGTSNSQHGITYTVRSDGSIYFTGTCVDDTATHYSQTHMPAGNMILTGMLGNPSQGSLPYVYRLQLMDWDRNVIKRQENTTPQSFTLATEQMVRCYTPNVMVGAVITGSVVQPMARVADFEDATYEKYNPEDIEVTIPDFIGTVCDGTYNPVTGRLVVRRVYVEYDENVTVTVGQSGTANWYYQFPQIPRLPKGSTSSSDLAAAELVSNQGVSTNITSTNTNQGFGLVTNNNSTTTIRMRYGTEQTPANFAATLANNHLQVSFLLAEPITYQISPAGLVLYDGNNTVWSETGDIALTYQADVYRNLMNKIADVEAMVLENIGG